MSQQFRAPRGTRDLLPADRPFWDRVETGARSLCFRYGFLRIDTPTFEQTDLFIRGVGEGTDIVDKEMYTFQDKGENSLTLRSEGTAPVMRSYIERGMHVLPQPVKLYYIASIFRYDRPQAGRYREHRQFGVEAIGETHASLDAEVIDLAHAFYSELGLWGVSLQLNSVGCPICQPDYLEQLVSYYESVRDQTCGNCHRRLVANPLRLLDCKEASCQPIIAEAPRIAEALCEECRDHFETLKEALTVLRVPFEVTPTLVRGLDYYTKTVFEFFVQGIGAQNAVGGGGRYDGLAELLGGSKAPGIGFGIGLDRVVLSLMEQKIEVPMPEPPHVFIVFRGPGAGTLRIELVRRLRDAGIRSASLYGSRSMKAQMRQANTSGAPYTLILGEDELERGVISCREMASSTQSEVPEPEIVDHLERRLGIGRSE